MVWPITAGTATEPELARDQRRRSNHESHPLGPPDCHRFRGRIRTCRCCCCRARAGRGGPDPGLRAGRTFLARHGIGRRLSQRVQRRHQHAVALERQAYGDVSGYAPIAPGTYAVSMRPHGAAATTPAVLTWTVDLTAGSAYTRRGRDEQPTARDRAARQHDGPERAHRPGAGDPGLEPGRSRLGDRAEQPGRPGDIAYGAASGMSRSSPVAGPCRPNRPPSRPCRTSSASMSPPGPCLRWSCSTRRGAASSSAAWSIRPAPRSTCRVVPYRPAAAAPPHIPGRPATPRSASRRCQAPSCSPCSVWAADDACESDEYDHPRAPSIAAPPRGIVRVGGGHRGAAGGGHLFRRQIGGLRARVGHPDGPGCYDDAGSNHSGDAQHRAADTRHNRIGNGHHVGRRWRFRRLRSRPTRRASIGIDRTLQSLHQFADGTLQSPSSWGSRAGTRTGSNQARSVLR